MNRSGQKMYDWGRLNMVWFQVMFLVCKEKGILNEDLYCSRIKERCNSLMCPNLTFERSRNVKEISKKDEAYETE